METRKMFYANVHLNVSPENKSITPDGKSVKCIRIYIYIYWPKIKAELKQQIALKIACRNKL